MRQNVKNDVSRDSPTVKLFWIRILKIWIKREWDKIMLEDVVTLKNNNNNRKYCFYNLQLMIL